MAMTDEQKAKLAKARAEARARKAQQQPMEPPITDPASTTTEHKYKGHTIHSEPSGRVVVAKYGLYRAEFDSMKKAEDYIDGV